MKLDHHSLGKSLTAFFSPHFSFPRLLIILKGVLSVFLHHTISLCLLSFSASFYFVGWWGGSCIFHGYTPLLAGNYIWKMNKQKGFDYPKQSPNFLFRDHTPAGTYAGGEPASLTLCPCPLIYSKCTYCVCSKYRHY